MTVTAQTATDVQYDQCEEQALLRGQLARAIKLLVKAHVCHYTARMAGDPKMFELEANLDTADTKWKQARQSYMEHRKRHGC